MVIAIVGSRDGLNWTCVELQIARLLARDDVGLVVSGGAIGVDRLGETMALAAGKRVHSIRPDWQKFGRSAGFRRNVAIVDMADEVYAFWNGKSRGTKHTIDIATKMKKPVHVHICSTNTKHEHVEPSEAKASKNPQNPLATPGGER